jgi:hypothetical protein
MQPARACRVLGPAVVGTMCHPPVPLPAGQHAPPSPPATKTVSSNDISALKLALAAAAPENVKTILNDACPARLGGAAYTMLISTFGK